MCLKTNGVCHSYGEGLTSIKNWSKQHCSFKYRISESHTECNNGTFPHGGKSIVTIACLKTNGVCHSYGEGLTSIKNWGKEHCCLKYWISESDTQSNNGRFPHGGKSIVIIV